MDSIDQLLHLRQGGLSIEEYVHQFCELSFQVPLYDEILFKDLFHFGLNKHIKSLFHKSLSPGGEFNGSLRDFMDYALLCAGSSFTVGVAKEERNTASVTDRADAPECTHKMAEATTHHQFPGNHHESRHVTADLPDSRHVTADRHEASHISADPPELLYVSADPPESHNMPAKPESAHVMPTKPGSAHVMPAMLESPARMATTPADAPLWPGKIGSVLDPPLVSVRAAGIPRSAALSAPSQELAESAPEPTPPQELAESAPEPAPPQELTESAPEPAPSQELAESAPEPAPSQELAESAPEPAPSQELAESAPEPAPSQELAEPLLVPSGSP